MARTVSEEDSTLFLVNPISNSLEFEYFDAESCQHIIAVLLFYHCFECFQF